MSLLQELAIDELGAELYEVITGHGYIFDAKTATYSKAGVKITLNIELEDTDNA